MGKRNHTGRCVNLAVLKREYRENVPADQRTAPVFDLRPDKRQPTWDLRHVPGLSALRRYCKRLTGSVDEATLLAARQTPVRLWRYGRRSERPL